MGTKTIMDYFQSEYYAVGTNTIIRQLKTFENNIYNIIFVLYLNKQSAFLLKIK